MIEPPHPQPISAARSSRSDVTSHKPRLTYEQMAEVKKCQQRKAEGLPCSGVAGIHGYDPAYQAAQKPQTQSTSSKLVWQYGVTTIPQRRDTYLPQTLESLRSAGFSNPWLFVDGDSDGRSWEAEFGLGVTCRSKHLRTAGHWVLTLWELYAANAWADRYAIFQDDFLTYQHLREYLETWYPERGYLNLQTFGSNEPVIRGREIGWTEAGIVDPSTPHLQTGRGAVALVFCREAVIDLLCSPFLVKRFKDHAEGWRLIDGGIVNALNHAGWREYIHNPSLVLHTGRESTVNQGKGFKKAMTFQGGDFDAREFIRDRVVAN